MFDQGDDKFEIQYKSTTIQLERLNLPGHVAFKAFFNSERQPLVVARAMNFNLNDFWTSIPEGRQKEAEGLGKLIEEYFANKEKQ